MTEVALRPARSAIWRGPMAVPLAMLGLYVLRLATVKASGAGLHVDEAQYWDWSRNLQWGYYSKPPAIAALIAASTAVLGETALGVRALAMSCWLCASLALWRLGVAMGSETAGRWAALCLAATPASGLLGLVATTDAPLVLCWSVAMFATWKALQSPRPGLGWVAVGLALGLGLLAKYTMAAIWLSLAWLAWNGRRREDLTGLVVASVVAGAMLLPNIGWNADHGWPTLRHTAEITVGAAASRDMMVVMRSLGEYIGGQLLLLGPALIGLIALLSRCACPAAWQDSNLQTANPTAFSLAFALPLLGIGLLQALNARTQMNWTAPALLGLCLWVGWRAVIVAAPVRWLVATTLLGVVLAGLLAAAGDLRRYTSEPASSAKAWDVWARMRGWDEALNSLRPALTAQPGLPIRAETRELIVHARYAWRDLDRPVQATPFDGPPRNHYEMLASREPLPRDSSWLLLSAGSPSGARRAACPEARLLAEGRSSRVVARLWLMAPTASCGGSP